MIDYKYTRLNHNFIFTNLVNHLSLSVFFFGILFLINSQTAQIMAQDFHVSGIVSDEEGSPLQDILLILYDSSSLEVERDTTDADGTYQISMQSTSIPPTKDVEIDSGFELGAFYPNPTIGQSILPVTIAEDGNYNINLFSIDGRLLQSVQTNFPVGTHHIHVNMPVAAGMYLLQVVSSDKQEVRKVTSLSGTGVEISVTGGEINGTNHYFPPAADNTPSAGREQISDETQNHNAANVLIAENGLTLVAYGGEVYQDYEVQFSEPGTYSYDITLSYDSDPSEEACIDLQLVADSSFPTHFVTVEGMRPEFGEEPYAWLYDMTVDEPGEDDRYPAFIEWIEDEESEDEGVMNRNQRSLRERILSGEINQARTAIPLHPGNHMGGGEAGLVIESEDQEIVCDPIPITIEPLEPAPGIIDLVVDELEDALISRAEDLGSSYSELITAEAWNLTADLAPVAAGLQAIDGPDNPNNIRAILSGDAPAFDDFPEGEDFELLEAIYHASGFAGSLLGIADGIGATTSIQELNLSNDNQTGLNATVWGDVTVDSPEHLHNLMDSQSTCATLNSGTAADARLVGGLVIAGAAFFVPGAQAAAGAASLALLITDMVISVCEDSLPSELSELSIEASQTIYNEDDSTLGYWNASISGLSEGFTLSWPDALGMVPGVGHAGRLANRVGREVLSILEIAEDALGFLQSFLSTAWGLVEDSGPVNFPPETFGPASIEADRDEEYISWELITLESPIGDHPFVFDEGDEHYYHPNAPGVSRLSLTTQPGKFLNQTATTHTDLEVRAIELSITDRETGQTPDFFVEPGESLKLEVTVSNADDSSVSWDMVGDGEIHIPDENGSKLDYVAPAEGGVELLIVTSEATGGARDNPIAPARSATARVNVTDDLGLVVYPDLPCLELDGTHDFKFVYDGEEIALSELEWDMTGPGTLGLDGSFVPVEEGEVTLIFYHPEEPDEVREISFSVREICSYLSLNSGQFQFESECVNYIIPVPDASMGQIQNGLADPFYKTITLIGEIVDADPPISTHLLFNDEMDSSFWLATQIVVDGMQFGWVVHDSMEGLPMPMQIERKMRIVDGQELPAWYGNFTMPYVNVDYYHETGIELVTMVFAEFSGVLEGEHGCYGIE